MLIHRNVQPKLVATKCCKMHSIHTKYSQKTCLCKAQEGCIIQREIKQEKVNKRKYYVVLRQAEKDTKMLLSKATPQKIRLKVIRI